MNQKELVLTAIVLTGLISTTTALSKEECFDCNQPVFSNTSSCSDFGGTCIDIQSKAGFGGLINYLSGIDVTEDKDGITFSCPTCTIKFKTSVFEKADSVNHVPPDTHR